MNQSEKADFLKEIVFPLWPKWSCSTPERDMWHNELEDNEWDKAQAAVRAYYAAGGSKSARPVISKVFGNWAKKAVDPCETETDVYVEQLDGKRRFGVFVLKSYSPDEKMQAAEQTRLKCARLYGGEWIVHKKNKAPVPDDGLRGKAALAQAEKNILAGPDTPGRRFLQWLGRKIAMADLLPVFASLPPRPDDDIPF